LLILASLASGPKHGYAMMEDIAEFCGTKLEPGTLYAALTRLERRGWIEALLTEQPLRLYQVTTLGLLAIEQAETRHQGEKLQEGGYPNFRRGREIIMRVVLWILHLYPLAWRERYEAEMVALLEQHAITFWTVLDLLVGALDARMDPHYRRGRQLLPLLRLQASWRWFASACVACWLGFFIWLGMLDLPTNTAEVCADFPGDTGCPMRVATLGVAIRMHTPDLPPLANAVLWDVGYLTFCLLLPFLLILSIWIVGQAMKRPRNLLCLLPVALFSLILWPSHPAWLSQFQNGRLGGLYLAVFFASLVLVSESAGAMLISARSWEKRHTLPLATFVRLVALVVLSGMAVMCLVTGVWLVDLWDALPLLNSVFPGLPVQLVLGFVIMVGALVTALIALVRSIVTLRGVSAAPNNPSSLPERGRIDRKIRMMVLSVGLFLFLGLTISSFVLHVLPTWLLFIPLVAVLGSIMTALAVKQYRVRAVDLPKPGAAPTSSRARLSEKHNAIVPSLLHLGQALVLKEPGHRPASPSFQGQTEGQITRLKLIKRQGYGRARFDLLRQRVLHAA
jgi:DNA-binding PadR family transcriptional regulator